MGSYADHRKPLSDSGQSCTSALGRFQPLTHPWGFIDIFLNPHGISSNSHIYDVFDASAHRGFGFRSRIKQNVFCSIQTLTFVLRLVLLERSRGFEKSGQEQDDTPIESLVLSLDDPDLEHHQTAG